MLNMYIYFREMYFIFLLVVINKLDHIYFLLKNETRRKIKIEKLIKWIIYEYYYKVVYINAIMSEEFWILKKWSI